MRRCIVLVDEEIVEAQQKRIGRLTTRKRQAEELERGFRLLGEHYYADRIRDCSGRLVFDKEAGTGELRLKEAYRCHVRTCPICAHGAAWKRAKKLADSLPLLREAHPKARWLFLTLTVGICEVEEVRSQIDEMHKSFGRLTNRKRWPGLAWFRFTEVARSGELAQPHIHALVMVNSSYFNGQNYLSKASWSELWMDCARLSFMPEVDCRLVSREDEENNLAGYIYYASKVEELCKEVQEQDGEWLAKVTLYLKGMRSAQGGGELLRLKPESCGSVKPEYQGDEAIYGWMNGRYVSLEREH
jgi:plasmid rolling circle replication initiator protein Rep